MRLHARPSLLIVLVILLGGFLVACKSTSSLAPPSAPGISVGITDDACPNIVVQAGQQVTWTNQDSREHIVRDKPAAGDGQFDSGTLQPGDSFNFTFLQPRSYTYDCLEGGATTGTITVQP